MTIQEDKRKLILQSALRNFVEEGYDRATMQNIASQASVGKGTIYEYFPSKEALFGEVILTGISDVLDELAEVMKKPGTVYSKVKGLYERSIELFLSEDDLRVIMLNDFGKVPKTLRQQIQKKHSEISSLVEHALEEGIASGEVPYVHSRVAASIVLNGLNVVYTYQLKDGETYEEIVGQLLQVLFDGLHTK